MVLERGVFGVSFLVFDHSPPLWSRVSVQQVVSERGYGLFYALIGSKSSCDHGASWQSPIAGSPWLQLLEDAHESVSVEPR